MITDSIRGNEGLIMISNKKLLIIRKGQHKDSCIYEPVLLYKL